MLREDERIPENNGPYNRGSRSSVTERKRPYVVPCASAFRDAIAALAERRRVNAGDLARSVLLLMPRDTVAAFPDPGEPGPGDRETVVLKSGPNADRPWRRKPRLQVRLPAGFEAGEIRRALAMALALDDGAVALAVEANGAVRAAERLAKAEGEAERLGGLVRTLSFEPLPQGVRTRADALFVLGFPPNSRPDASEIRTRFRKLAAVHHPDSGFGHHERMTQLNEALSLLRDR